ncbi:MAG: glycosyltransferase [Beijerinckiaceae bacterium]|nr:glycosyltransferase [Beijerinckiaceae bacterium]
MIGFLVIAIALLALLPVVNTLATAFLLRTPLLPAVQPSVAILIPARDEEASIGPCVEAALASVGADIEVIVLDDGSTDGTQAIVEAIAKRDPRVRVVPAPPLPAGWKGKPHACHVLAGLTARPFLLFVDADVRIAPETAARMMPPDGTDLVSGVPRQVVIGFMERAIVPMINSLIFGYLPLWMARRRRDTPSLAAACGQLLMVRASAYHASGGHRAIANRMHDALSLARAMRAHGFATDLVDATHLASCRMYETAEAVWSGFAKNAVEGMARPLALPIWTSLLLGGQIAPFLILGFGYATGSLKGPGLVLIASVCALLVLARSVQAVKCQERWSAVLIHPIGIILTLCIQWQALYHYARGRRTSWRGRSYAVDL